MTGRRVAILVSSALLIVACSDSKPVSPASSAAATASSATPERALRVLVSNDDGVGAAGIDSLVQALAAEPNVTVTVVAPAENQSGSGGKTSPGPVAASEATTASGFPAVSVQGSPADAVIYGLTTVVKERPDVVISGTNAGQNIGPFIDLSGTIGAARAAAQRDVPALAVSAGLGDPIDFAAATTRAVQWLRDHRAALLALPTVVFVDNLNAPTCPTGHVRDLVNVTVEATASGDDALAPPDCSSTAPAPPGDVAAFHLGFATLSPVPLTASS